MLEGIMLAPALSLVVVFHVTALQDGLVNGRFEDGAVGGVPKGWIVPTRDYRAETLADGASDGGRCVRLRLADGPRGDGPSNPFGNFMQSIDARPWRGKPIRLEASVRVLGAARAQMWLRVDRAEDKMGLFDNMGDRPVLSETWTECEITGVVDPDAERLNVGMMLIGEGELFVESFELESTGTPVEFVPPEPPRALSERGLANLLAYAELFGYVRHFHPSDEAAAAYWEAVAVEGVRAVEAAASPRELADALSAHFAPLAPSVRVFPAGESPREPMAEKAPDARRVAYWEHSGFGQSGGIYESERKRLASAAELPPEVQGPDHPFAAELAGGVACLVPLSVYVGDEGTLPKAIARPPEPGAEHRPSGDDRATRLADVVLAWNVFQHFYPYFDVAEVDWRAELERALRSAAEDRGEREFLDTLRRMVAALGDGHGNVYHGSEGRGATLPLDWDWIGGALVVTAVAEGIARPAPGDVVLSIDGVPVAQELAAAEALISGATPQWIRVRALQRLRTRASAAPCVLELAAYPDDERVRAELAPQPAPLDAAATLPAKVAELEPDVWYVDLGRIVPADLEAALERLADARGIVFDLRGYPRGIGPAELFGHLIESPVTSQQWHVPLVRRPNREQLAFERGGEWNLVPLEPYFQAEKAFLTGGGAISYAESCMGIVEHYGLAAIVGGPTAGTNGNVNPFQLPGGYRVAWTGMKVLKHDGSRHHGVGIQPTVPVARTRAGVAEGRDEVLESALEIVR